MTGVIVMVFTILYLTPGDAVDVITSTGEYTEEQKAEMRHEMGLDQPYIVQLFNYFKQLIVNRSFGTAMINKTDIGTDIAQRLPYSLTFAICGILIALLLGVPLGIYAALHQNGVGDTAATVLSLLFVSMPGFFLALMLVLIFAYKLDILPAMYSMEGGLKYWILPILANCFSGVATMCRLTRSGMLEVIRSDYVVMAKAKGVPYKSVIWKHALPNAMIPLITSASMMFGSMLGGGLIIEKVFSIPGLGTYLATAVNQRDTFAVQGGVIVTSVFFSLMMLLADVVIAFIDPRIRAKYQSVKKRRA